MSDELPIGDYFTQRNAAYIAQLERDLAAARAEAARLRESRECGHLRQFTLDDYDLCLYCEVVRLRKALERQD